MVKFLLTIMAFIVFAGCATIPAKYSTPMAKHNKLMVRDINWNETAISDLSGNELKAYIASQPRLNEIFKEEFGKYIKKIGYFEAITYGDGPVDSDTLILEPKIYTIKPGGYMPGASYTGMLKSADGKLVAKYDEERRVNSSSNSLVTIEKLIKELAEDAASKLPYAQ